MSTETMTGNQALRNFVRQNGSILIFCVLSLTAAIFVKNFARPSNMIIILKQSSIPIIACVGMTIVLMTGGIDLSLGYNIGLCSIVVGLMVKTWAFPIWLSILVTLILGGLVGLFNGACVQIIRVPAFITTLGTGYILLGVAQIISDGIAVNRLPAPFLAIGKTPVGVLNTTILISAAICLIFYYLLHHSTYGRQLSAFGLNPVASQMSGVPTAMVNMSVYVISGVMAAVTGILLSIDVNCAQPTMGGGGYTFTVITGAVLGGVSLYGGVGSVVGAVFGILILKVIGNCINLMNAAYYLTDAIMGIIILFAIIFENLKNRKL